MLVSMALVFGLSGGAVAQQAPDEFMQKLTNELLDMVRKDPALRAGDLQKIGVVLDTKLKPYINFQRMTAAAVGPAWRQATPEQQKRLQEEFKLLLMRSYSGALSQIKDNSTIVVKPVRQTGNDNELVVRSEIRGSAEPVPIDYRLEKTPNGWKVYDINVLGVWLVENYRNQFTNQINQNGIDGLIAFLKERNKMLAAARPSN